MATKKKDLTNGPLSAVLFQVRYTPILNIERYIPAIQDYCRKAGFPLINRMRGDMIHINQNGEIEKIAIEQWVFASADYQRTLIIDTEKLTFQVFDLSNYVFKELLDTFIQFMHKIDTLVEISLINRIGLRFINTIEEKPELGWRRAIKPEFQGYPFPDDVDWADKELFSWTLQKNVKLIEPNIWSNFYARIYQDATGRKYPGDIIRDPDGDIDYVSSKSLVTYIDLDHCILFSNEEKEVIMPKIKEIFVALHKVIESVFFSSLITKEAEQVWSK